MATSAFRSTTRRNCQIGSSGSREPGGVPSTPRSKRDPSPSGRGLHRRSSSMSDFSARYFSDCSSTSNFRSYDKGPRSSRSSVCPSDSESDMDSLYAHRRPRKWGAESEDERQSILPESTISIAKSERKGLRRTFSSQDFSQNISKMRQNVSDLDVQPAKNDTEDLVEEKTIKAVYAQMKQSLHSDPPVGDLGMSDFLDAMRIEVRQAVSDIRLELEESRKKNSKLSAQDRSDSQGTDVIQAVADIRKEYTAKLEESEKRIQELWSQIAVEEGRCLELSKIVKELLPTPPPSITTSSAHNTSNRRRSTRRKNSAERQLDSKSLDEEALKYLEECVSISSYDCPGNSDDSIQEKENSSRQLKGRGSAARSPSSMERGCKGEVQSKLSSMGSDGVFLPWLQWEAEGGSSLEKNSKQAEKITGGSPSSEGKSKSQFHKSSNASFGAAKKLCLLEPKEAGSSSLFTVDDYSTALAEGPVLDVDTLLFERIKFRCRVEKGELLLCQGLFLM